MPQHSESRVVPYDPDVMFAVVADVERYPEFLPWVLSLRVLSRALDAGKEIVIAEMLVGFAALRERYTSRIVMDPAARRIDVRQVHGVFRELENCWRFKPEGQGCRIDFFVRFEFRSRLLGMVAGTAMSLAVSSMTHAFEERARKLALKQALQKL
ncbi:MAG: type II toxin-antitoxin system RatA family toxin [Alphaproteobacteria bacterium]|nr:type II toxin-antitoxin system RatA family toxin [Alphaproteobacteria bacterium]